MTTVDAVRSLDRADVEAYLVHAVAHAAESGHDGEGYSGPNSRYEDFPVEEIRSRTHERWSKPLDQPHWRRAWGCFDGATMVGAANVAGGEIAAELHRVDLGISILRGYRRLGLGRGLMESVITWCRAQEAVAWLDLGVFGDNLGGQHLFESLGFEAIGRTDDRWRVDGNVIDEISMTLRV